MAEHGMGRTRVQIPLGPCVFFLILARRRLYGGMEIGMGCRGEEEIGMAEHGMADYYCSLNC
jgi:hypothetical protein